MLIEVSPYYRQLLEKHGTTPADVHGGMELCSEVWSEADWNEFYLFIFECIQKYLKHGLPKFHEESEVHKRATLVRRCGSRDLLNKLLELLERASTSGEEMFCEQFYAELREAFPGLSQTDSMLLGLLKETAHEKGFLFNPHKNGNIDKQRLSGDRWNRWVTLGLDQASKKGGGLYAKDDRVSVFRISRQGDSEKKSTLERLWEQS